MGDEVSAELSVVSHLQADHAAASAIRLPKQRATEAASEAAMSNGQRRVRSPHVQMRAPFDGMVYTEGLVYCSHLSRTQH